MAVAVALAVTLVAFLLLHLTGDPAIALAGDGASNSEIEAIRERYGFDRPLPLQYIEWLLLIVQGNLGTSLYFREPVLDVIAARIGVTLLLSAYGFIVAVVLSLPLGIVAAINPGGWADRTAQAVAAIGQAMPIFWFPLILMLIFGVYLRLLPVSGAGTSAHFILPAVSLGYYFAPPLIRLTRAGMIEALGSDYIRTARAKGLRLHTVVLKHAFPNALLPVIALAAVQFGFMLSGSIVTETIFSLPGLGHLAWVSITRGDFPVILGIILVFSLVFILLVLIADLVSAWIDPRLRRQN
jgi:ABC-type dipeptide/oligopeptide/nickel transport system permease component